MKPIKNKLIFDGRLFNEALNYLSIFFIYECLVIGIF